MPRRTLVGLQVEGRRIARQGAEVRHDGQKVGFVTSGTLSPTFDKVLAMALIERGASEPGTPVEVDIRGTPARATVCRLPFYRRGQRT